MDFSKARELFPATRQVAYLNTAAVGLASTRLTETYARVLESWTANGFDYVRGEAAATAARAAVSRLIGAAAADVALVPAVSAAAGLVAAQFLPAAPDENLIVGEQEYSSNHFPWRQLAARGYDIRLAAFRDGGVLPDEVARHADGGTRLIAVSAVQSATGHRTDLAAISRIAHEHGALLFVDGSQSVGALDVAEDTSIADFMAFSDHKFLLNAGRGMGYLYIRREHQPHLVPFGAGWRAGDDPFASFFGPRMVLSETASRFDSSISWLAAIGDEMCLDLINEIGPAEIYTRNRELADHLRFRLAERGLTPHDPGPGGRTHIVAVPLPPERLDDAATRLQTHGVAAALRGGFVRFAVDFYNDEEDIERAVRALT
jgi:cysteine desulfurase/selenocysteine lyase